MTAESRISIGLEQGADGWLWAHPLSLAGCAAAGPTPEAAVAAFEAELVEWLGFVAAAGMQVPSRDAELELAVDEWIATDADVREGESYALFAADVAALSNDEMRLGLRLLGDLRGALLAAVRAIPRRDVEAALESPAEEGWTAREVLEELARAQWWTVSRLGATPLGESPDSTLARLDTAMALVVREMVELPPDRRALRLELDDEEWTPRKVMRRLLWLEWTLGRAAARALGPTTPTGR